MWPSRSTDLNRIENLWKKIQFSVHQRNAQNMSKLKVICQYEWNKIGTNFSEELISNYSKRLLANTTKGGNDIKYRYVFVRLY